MSSRCEWRTGVRVRIVLPVLLRLSSPLDDIYEMNSVRPYEKSEPGDEFVRYW